jgi:outer membrane usher protein
MRDNHSHAQLQPERGDSRARKRGGPRSNSQYANLRPGINMWAVAFTQLTTWSRDASGKDQWDTVYSYATCRIPLKAQLTVGDSSAPADVFDSMPFRGVQLASDDDMLPDSLKGYAPVVAGLRVPTPRS